MADTIRQALERLLAVIKPKYTDPDEIVAVVRAMAAARTALAAERPAPAPADHVPDAGDMVAADEEREEREELARWLQFEADNAQELGCATIYDHDRLRWAADYLRQPVPAPAPAVDGEHEELAQWLERIGDDYDDLYRSPSALIRPKLARAAALLRRLPPKGMEAIRYCVEEDGAVIQRTSRPPESWAIRAGSACMSTTGEWDIEPMPSDRTDEWLANHRWPSAAAAWEALQQARRQEVGDE